MGKIIQVDFEEGKKQFTWDDQLEQRIQLTQDVNKDMLKLVEKIRMLTHDDAEYQNYIGRVFKGIVLNLRERIH